jgi:hypothetical protein
MPRQQQVKSIIINNVNNITTTITTSSSSSSKERKSAPRSNVQSQQSGPQTTLQSPPCSWDAGDTTRLLLHWQNRCHCSSNHSGMRCTAARVIAASASSGAGHGHAGHRSGETLLHYSTSLRCCLLVQGRACASDEPAKQISGNPGSVGGV